jgi:hypothetical protein
MLPAAWDIGKTIWNTGKQIFKKHPKLQQAADRGKDWAKQKLGLPNPAAAAPAVDPTPPATGQGIRRKRGKGAKRGYRRRAMGMLGLSSGPLA